MDLTIPQGTDAFLASNGWGGAAIDPLPGDASFRRYFRISHPEKGPAMLMHAPPPNEDPLPFLRAAYWLCENALRAPRVFGEQADQGFVLLEDFGTVRMREFLDDNPDQETAVYQGAIEALGKLHQLPAGPFPEYSLAEYQREAGLFIDWFCPARGLTVDADGWKAAWDAVLSPMMQRQSPGVVVLRDYHAENIMLLGSPQAQGLLDFQDALVGHPAYDLVSLLQDARRDVSPQLEARMLESYLAMTGEGEDFTADYARLGAQRNAKIVGIFVRLWQRDGKPRYLDYIPRVWALMERDLAHPALEPVARWFAANIPADVRAAGGGAFSV